MRGYEIDFWTEMLNSETQYPRFRFNPFRIIFYLSSPICLTTPFINLDSVIDHLMFAEKLGRYFFITPKKMNLSRLGKRIHRKPYGAFIQDGIVLPAITSGIIDNQKYHIETIYKRFEDRFVNFTGKIRNNQGHFKSFAMKHIYIPATKITFEIHGDRDFIEQLFDRNLFALGNDIRIGYGAIKKIETESINEFSLIKDGFAQRPIPVEFCHSYEDAAIIPYRPPYWAKSNNKLCVVPFTKCEAKIDLSRVKRN